MVVHLQSLGMVAEALSARLDRGTLGAEDLHGMVSKLNRLSRQAVTTCVEVSTWMQPAEDDAVSLREYRGEHLDQRDAELSCRDVLERSPYPVEVIGPALADEASMPHEGAWKA